MRTDYLDSFSNTILNIFLTRGPTFAISLKQAFYTSYNTILLLCSILLYVCICFYYFAHCYIICSNSDRNRFYKVNLFYRSICFFLRKGLFQSKLFCFNRPFIAKLGVIVKHCRHTLKRAGFFNFINIK